MKLIVLVGAIASGKSTFSSLLADKGYIVCNDDAVVNALHSNKYTLYDKELKPLYKAVENQIVMTALALGQNVVVDKGTSNKAKSRQRFIGLAASLDAEVWAVQFPVESPEIVASRRFNHDSRGIPLEKWVEIARHHEKEREPVRFSEGFNRILEVKNFNDIERAGSIL